jgi:DNA polymerase III delta prime subunit
LRSLFITDPTEDKNALKRRKGDRAFGTCSWILETDELQHWLGLSGDVSREEGSILWLYGNPGTGKSTMAITLTEELLNKPYFQSNNKTLAYFFCDSSSEINRTATSILRGLLYQLIKKHPILMEHFLPRYAERKDKLFSSFDALWAALMDIDKNSNNLDIYCIIDALDECDLDSQKILLGQIDQTFNNLNSKHASPLNIHILITSRPYHEIRQYLASFRCKDLATYKAVANDLKTVIQERVEILSKRNRYPKTVIAETSRILEDKAEGTFLWVGIACDELSQVQSRNAVKTLQALPRGLDSLYHKLLNMAITTSSEDDERIIVEMLSFVAFALRPLTLVELSEACRLYPDEEEDCRLQFAREFIDSCRLMIIIQGRHVRLLHKSVKDFLVKETRKINGLKVNATLAYRCISSILQTCQLGIDERISDASHGFLNYSISYWPEHASLSETQFTVIREHESFFLLGSKSWGKWLYHYNSLQRYRLDKLDAGFSTCHAAARWGIPQLIRYALDGANADRDNANPTCGERIFVDSDFMTVKGVTPLAEAARSGQIESMRILLEKGPRGQQISKNVIKAAAGNFGHGKQVMILLLDRHRDQIMITEDVIEAAAENTGNGKEVMTVLLDWCKDQFLASAQLISTVIQNFDRTVVTFLLDRCGDQTLITEDMIKAAAQNYWHGKGIMTLLLERCKDQIQTSTQLASAIIQNFDETVVSFLLNRCGNQIQITEDIFKAAARNYRNEKVMSLVLDQYGDQIQITVDAGVWNNFSCINRRGEYDYADSQKHKTWQAYAAETGASAVKDFLGYLRSINREG